MTAFTKAQFSGAMKESRDCYRAATNACIIVSHFSTISQQFLSGLIFALAKPCGLCYNQNLKGVDGDQPTMAIRLKRGMAGESIPTGPAGVPSRAARLNDAFQ